MATKHLILTISLLLICQATANTVKLQQSNQPIEDFDIDVDVFPKYLSLLRQINPLFSSDIDFEAIRTRVINEFQQQLTDGIFPMVQREESLTFYNFRASIADTMVRYNIYMPQVNLADLFRQGRQVISGEIELQDFLDSLDFDEAQSSENTIDDIEQYLIVVGNFWRGAIAFPLATLQGEDAPENQVQVPLEDQLRDIGQQENPDNKIPNTRSISGAEVAYQYITAFNFLADNLGAEPILDLLDYTIRSLEAAINYDYRIGTVIEV